MMDKSPQGDLRGLHSICAEKNFLSSTYTKFLIYVLYQESEEIIIK